MELVFIAVVFLFPLKLEEGDLTFHLICDES